MLTARLTIEFLLVLCIEIPVIAFFFIKKEREKAMLIALIVNFISWPIMQSLLFLTDIDFKIISNRAILAGGFMVLECIAYQYLLEIRWKKAILMSFFANLFSFAIGVLLLYLFKRTNTTALPTNVQVHAILFSYF